MEPDYILVAALVLLILSVPSILSAFAESRPPRVSLLMVLAGSGMLAYAMYTKPGGYTMQGMAEAVYRVIGALIS